MAEIQTKTGMIANIQKYIITALAVAFAVLLFYSVSITESYYEQKKLSKTLENTVSNTNQELKSVKIRLNDSTAVYAARVADLEYTAKNFKARYDSLLKVAAIKPADVRHITTVGTQIQERILSVPVYYDSFGGLKTGYKDSFTDISVEIDSTKKATIDYSVRDSLIVINTQKQHKLLWGLIKWREPLNTTVLSTNPKMKISAVTSINKIE